MPKISALPAMTTADGADPAPIVDDSAGSTKKITLTKLKEWLQSLTAWVTRPQIDWTTFSNNIKTAVTTTANTPTNGVNTNLSGNGASLSFTLTGAGYAHVYVSVGCISSSDFECKPLIFLNGALHTTGEYVAAAGNASGRVNPRTVMAAVALPTGSNTISAGILVSSATGQSVPIANGKVSAIVFGNVTA